MAAKTILPNIRTNNKNCNNTRNNELQTATALDRTVGSRTLACQSEKKELQYLYVRWSTARKTCVSWNLQFRYLFLFRENSSTIQPVPPSVVVLLQAPRIQHQRQAGSLHVDPWTQKSLAITPKPPTTHTRGLCPFKNHVQQRPRGEFGHGIAHAMACFACNTIKHQS